MFIGIARYDLFIAHSGSLKDKRQVVRAVTMSVQKKFNVAIAEIDFQDKWQRAALGVSCVAESPSHCGKVLQAVEKQISRAAIDGGELVDRTVEVIAMDDLL